MLRFIGASSLLQQGLCVAIAFALWWALARAPKEAGRQRLVLAHVLALVAWPVSYSILYGSLSPSTSTVVTMGIQFGPAMLTGWALLMSSGGQDRVNPGVLVVALVPIMSVVYALETHQAAVWSAAWLVMASPAVVARRVGEGCAVVVRGFRASLLVVWLLIVLLAMLRPGESFQACRLDKCSLVGTFLAPGGVSNGLGVTFALLLPVAVLGLSTRRLLVAGGVGLLMIDYTGSRAALLAAAVGLGMVACYRLRSHALRRLALSALGLGALVASLGPALHSFPPQTATSRGALWIRAKDLIDQQPVFGHGPSFWVRQVATSEIVSNYSAHNIWLELLVATGVVGLLAIIVGTAISVVQADPAVRPLLLIGLVTLIACGVFEAPVMPYRLSLTPGVFIALLLASGLRARSAPEPATPVLGALPATRRERALTAAGSGGIQRALSGVGD